ncbi:MAG: hypothetical protein J6038_03380 [Bacilli bacterium]|nr:hypothetical protein [Bacilli bacterium]
MNRNRRNRNRLLQQSQVYDAEGTVYDFIRNSDRVEREFFVKFRHYTGRKKNKDVNNLMRYAKTMGMQDKANSLMEIVRNEN